MKSHKDLFVWQKSIELVVEVYYLTSNFPKSELFVMVSQMRRAVISIPSNIAEGYARRSSKERLQFYLISFGSACELETQIIIAKKLGFVDGKNSIKADGLLNEVLRMLNKMTIESRTSH